MIYHFSLTILIHTNFHTQHFVPHHLSHLILTYTIFHTPFSYISFYHISSFSYNCGIHHLSHTILTHTIFHIICRLYNISSFIYNFNTHHLSHTTLSYTTLSHTIFHTQFHLHFAWHAWHLWHWAGSGDALGRAWSPVILSNFTWQTSHLATWTSILTGVAVMALGWLWWRAWARLNAFGFGCRYRRPTLRGKP